MMPVDLARSMFSAIARIFHDNAGATATIMAIALPSMIGFGALGTETGVWFTIKLQNQSAADAAAIAAAYEVIAGKTNVVDNLTPAASEAATRNGYAGSTPAVIYPYSDANVSDGIAVTLQQTQQGLLSSMFLSGVTISTRAVAVIKVLDNPCVLARARSGTGVEVVSSASLDVPKCSVAANSTSYTAIDIQDDTSSIAAAALVTQGEISVAGNPIDSAAPPPELILDSPPMIGAPAVKDPYASTLTHAFLTARMPASCATGPPYPANSRICGGLSINNVTVDLLPGTYWITNGDLSLQSNAVLKCSTCSSAEGGGVTIILTTGDAGAVGNVQIPRGSAVTLQAPNNGTFAGLLFVQDPLAALSGVSFFEGESSMHLTGLVYVPSTTVTFRGNPNPTCTVLVSNQAVIEGKSHLTTSRCRSAGLTSLPRIRTVALGE
jgi:Flp pilus assembly protein TadG